MLQEQIPPKALVTIDNEHVVRGELPTAMAAGRVLRISALPSFLKTYIDRLTFSFTDYLRNEKDSSTELHQWIREELHQLSRAGAQFAAAAVMSPCEGCHP